MFWYNIKDNSFGFANDKQINVGRADKCKKDCEGDSNQRLSLHLTGKHGGWRLGNIAGLNKSDRYFKAIYLKNPAKG